MRLNKINVSGKLKCEYVFNDVNVLLGDNNSGKTTLLKLILYCLGAPIHSFIDEISQDKLCKNVSLEVTFKNGKEVRIVRKLPDSEAFIVTPIKNDDEIVNDEITVFDAGEFSDFLLENEGYSTDKIVYAKDKIASFRFYFLLRALYVDQDTPAYKILSDLDMGHDYFTGQPLIKKSIIEKMLGKDNSELQKIRAEIQRLNKENTKCISENSFLKEQKQIFESQYQYDWKKLEAKLLQIKEEKELLANVQYDYIAKVEDINNTQISSDLITKQKELKQKIQTNQILQMEIMDLEEVLKSLSEDMVALNYKIAAKDILDDLPILYCPNCLSELSKDTIEKGLCENCKKKTTEEKILNNAALKKALNDSLQETKDLLQIKRNILIQNKKEISLLEKSIQKNKQTLFSEVQYDRNLIQNSINEIKERLEYLINEENILIQYRKIKNDLEDLDNRKKDISNELKDNQKLLLKADNKAASAMEYYQIFKQKFSQYLKIMFGEISECALDENYMPIIDNNKMTSVSSASLKVAIRISYLLALFNANTLKDGMHVGFLLLDSPKDKDLDDYRFAKYLETINNECNGQLLITGSISDKEIYTNKLYNATFFEELSTNSKLLKE